MHFHSYHFTTRFKSSPEYQLREFMKRYLELRGRLILQDLPSVLEEVSDVTFDPRIEKQDVELMSKDLIFAVPGLELVKLWRPPVQGEGVVEVIRTE